MRRKRNAMTLFAAAAGTATALIAGPTAVADPPPGCDTNSDSTGDCLTPGDGQPNPAEQFVPGDDYGTFFGFPEVVPSP